METPSREMQYWRAWGALFQNPNWGINLTLATVCQLIPLLGPVVLYGWLAEVVESLHTRPGQTYPDFKFERFGIYLGRGIWPFLVLLLCGLATIPVALLAVGVPALLLLLDDGPVTVGVVVVLASGLYVVCFLLAGMLAVPVEMRAMLMQSFGGAFSWSFIKDFAGRVWGEMVATMLFLGFTSFLAVVAGYAMCFVGMYPMMTLFSFAMVHLHFQLYELYLTRGGMPIPLKNPPPEAPPELPPAPEISPVHPPITPHDGAGGR